MTAPEVWSATSSLPTKNSEDPLKFTHIVHNWNEDITLYYENLQQKLTELTTIFPTSVEKAGLFLKISNSGRRGEVRSFPLPLSSVLDYIDSILPHCSLLKPYTRFDQDSWRRIAKGIQPSLREGVDPSLPNNTWTVPAATGDMQVAFESFTKPTFTSLVKIICLANSINYTDETPLPIEPQQLENAKESLKLVIQEVIGINPATSSRVEPGRNVIIYGAPGTGKSYRLKTLQNSTRCVFHADYLNSDFMGSYKPFQDIGGIQYRFIPGPFIQTFIHAIENSDEPVNLIIEELNRGNAGAILGELIQLLDRDIAGRSEYEINVSPELHDYLKDKLGSSWLGHLYIPNNMSLYATMNSADQGVMPLDSAFKRRWEFEFTSIEFNRSDQHMNTPYLHINNEVYSWRALGETINRLLVENGTDEDRLIGQYFLSQKEISDELSFKNALSKKLFIYLWDDILRHGKRELIFNNRIKSFSALQVKFKESDDVFSDSFKESLAMQEQEQ